MSNDKKLILTTLFAFGFGCVVIGQMIWCIAHYWGTWRSWLFCGLGVVNVVTASLLVRSHLKWFDARVAWERCEGRVEILEELKNEP